MLQGRWLDASMQTKDEICRNLSFGFRQVQPRKSRNERMRTTYEGASLRGDKLLDQGVRRRGAGSIHGFGLRLRVDV